MKGENHKCLCKVSDKKEKLRIKVNSEAHLAMTNSTMAFGVILIVLLSKLS